MKKYIYIILTGACFGTIGVLVKLIGDSVPFMSLNFFRVFLGFLFLISIVPFFDKKLLKITKKDLKDFFMIGFIFALSSTFFNGASLLTTVQNVTFITSTYPFFVFIFAYLLLREKVTWVKMVTLIIAIIGIAVINPFSFGENILGNLLAVLAAILFALLVTEMRKEDKDHGIGDVAWFLFFASVFLLPFPFVYGFGDLSEAGIYLIILGFISTGLAYLLFNLGLQKMEAETASIINIIVTPLVAVPLAFFAVQEAITPRVIIGGCILIASGIYLQLENKRLKKRRELIEK